MKHYSVSELEGRILTYGRTFRDSVEDILYFNWSGSTVEFLFTGTHLNLSFRADCGYEIEGIPSDPHAPRRATWPVAAVFLDDIPTPLRKFQIGSPNETWLVYQSQETQTHRIRITKLTENVKTFLGITAITAEGEFLTPQRKPRKRVEIVGDSITCGYGNLVVDSNRHFFSMDEDNWQAYGPIAARAMDLEYSCVSVSGITAVKHPGWMSPYAMCELYNYVDKPMQDKLGQEPIPMDFTAAPNDYVVVNLGTNDNYAILFCPEEGELGRFQAAYTAFIQEIRRVNGPDTKIICSLGTMNYFLYTDIQAAVAEYQQRTGDPNIYTMRFTPIHPMDGLGADGHPSLTTHKKMAEDLIAFLRTL